VALRVQHADSSSAEHKTANEGSRKFVVLHCQFLPVIACAKAGAHATRSKSVALFAPENFPGDSFEEYPAMTNRTDADFFQVLLR
jgi:hypothetical protein